MAEQAEGIVSLPTHSSVDETISRLQSMLQEKGVQIFALIDHSGEAKRAGFEMRATKLLVFSSPRAGTPLMLESPSIAIDLPLKLLVWEDASGQVWISWNTPEYLQKRHQAASLTAELSRRARCRRSAGEERSEIIQARYAM